MPLTAAQTLTLKNAISTTPILAAYPNTADGHADLAALLNKVASPEFWVWASDVNVQEIRARITWANLTPLDVPDGTAAWTNRALQCHGKQFAIQLIVPMIGTFSATDANIRAGLQDALTGVRSGAGGASLGAGWAAVPNEESNETQQARAAHEPQGRTLRIPQVVSITQEFLEAATNSPRSDHHEHNRPNRRGNLQKMIHHFPSMLCTVREPSTLVQK